MSTKYKISLICLLSMLLLGCEPRPEISYTQEGEVKLSAPIPLYQTSLFEDSVILDFAPTFPNSYIRYTVNGQIPDLNSPTFEQKKIFHHSAYVQAYTIHNELQASDVVAINLVKATRLTDIKEITLSPEAHPNYPGGGVHSLVDLEKGTLNFREKAWMGFSAEEIEIKIVFEEKRPVYEVAVSTMQDHGSWIFYPQSIEVFTRYGNALSGWKLPKAAETPQLAYLSVNLDHVNTDQLIIKIKNNEMIPAWHAGAGTMPWTFIDEILIR